MSVGAAGTQFDEVVERLVAGGEIKDWRAREILAGLQDAVPAPADGSAAGKVILLGEHGVVYGRHALAVPLPDAVRVTLREAPALSHDLPGAYVDRLLDALGVTDTGWRIDVDCRLPLGKGLGSSAAIASSVWIVVRSSAAVSRAKFTKFCVPSRQWSTSLRPP